MAGRSRNRPQKLNNNITFSTIEQIEFRCVQDNHQHIRGSELQTLKFF